ncbi:hypothetical protein HHK36_012047 [Tetracentron sinense]|uniref:C2H2-type domain-containing protein n=1 Tax=Tetracentron sinense TaxID=13715 RepID=A0A834ZBT8_TETSI|nr:hypothetical protein HHK36_012047 [Tetracentron sinense]
MEKTGRETHDFMNVDSFSQLPFIRPAPPVREKAVRLFGIEFNGDVAVTDGSVSSETNMCEDVKDNENGESSRKFGCHYCCRNFPTSQALGGHQNAHKRERQHAKRAHLQSAITAHNSIPNVPMYGPVNYRLGSAPTLTYPSWNNNSNTIASSNRLYGSNGSYSKPPINGSPLALWRIPSVQSSPSYNQDPSSPLLPLFGGGDGSKPVLNRGSSPQSQNVYESKPGVHDHVSLDLHL